MGDANSPVPRRFITTYPCLLYIWRKLKRQKNKKKRTRTIVILLLLDHHSVRFVFFVLLFNLFPFIRQFFFPLVHIIQTPSFVHTQRLELWWTQGNERKKRTREEKKRNHHPATMLEKKPRRYVRVAEATQSLHEMSKQRITSKQNKKKRRKRHSLTHIYIHILSKRQIHKTTDRMRSEMWRKIEQKQKIRRNCRKVLQTV